MYIYYFKYKYLTIANTRYKEFRSVKWTVRRSSLNMCACFLVVADNIEVLQAHFVQKVMELLSLTLSAKYCTHPNASSVTYILLRRNIGPNLVKNIYTVSRPSSLLLNEYYVINRAELPLDAAQRERFSKIVN